MSWSHAEQPANAILRYDDDRLDFAFLVTKSLICDNGNRGTRQDKNLRAVLLGTTSPSSHSIKEQVQGNFVLSATNMEDMRRHHDHQC
jgi:hypothetical protein